VIFKSQEAPFVMELPPYRLPTFKASMKNMWFKGSQYLRKMGGIILIAVILIWAAGYFPKNTAALATFDQQIEQIKNSYHDQILTVGENSDPSAIGLIRQKMDQEILSVSIEKESFRLENSFIGILGRFVEPAIRPLGFDWKMGISLITGAAAKEIVVSTMAVLYQTTDSPDSHQSLIGKLQNQTYSSGDKKGEHVFTPVVAFAFLIFVLIYFPCVAVVAAVKKETGGWKWAAFLAAYTTILAYIMAFLVYQIGSLFY